MCLLNITCCWIVKHQWCWVLTVGSVFMQPSKRFPHTHTSCFSVHKRLSSAATRRETLCTEIEQMFYLTFIIFYDKPSPSSTRTKARHYSNSSGTIFLVYLSSALIRYPVAVSLQVAEPVWMDIRHSCDLRKNWRRCIKKRKTYGIWKMTNGHQEVSVVIVKQDKQVSSNTLAKVKVNF